MPAHASSALFALPPPAPAPRLAGASSCTSAMLSPSCTARTVTRRDTAPTCAFTVPARADGAYGTAPSVGHRRIGDATVHGQCRQRRAESRRAVAHTLLAGWDSWFRRVRRKHGAADDSNNGDNNDENVAYERSFDASSSSSSVRHEPPTNHWRTDGASRPHDAPPRSPWWRRRLERRTPVASTLPLALSAVAAPAVSPGHVNAAKRAQRRHMRLWRSWRHLRQRLLAKPLDWYQVFRTRYEEDYAPQPTLSSPRSFISPIDVDALDGKADAAADDDESELRAYQHEANEAIYSLVTESWSAAAPRLSDDGDPLPPGEMPDDVAADEAMQGDLSADIGTDPSIVCSNCGHLGFHLCPCCGGGGRRSVGFGTGNLFGVGLPGVWSPPIAQRSDSVGGGDGGGDDRDGDAGPRTHVHGAHANGNSAGAWASHQRESEARARHDGDHIYDDGGGDDYGDDDDDDDDKDDEGDAGYDGWIDSQEDRARKPTERELRTAVWWQNRDTRRTIGLPHAPCRRCRGFGWVTCEVCEGHKPGHAWFELLM